MSTLPMSVRASVLRHSLQVAVPAFAALLLAACGQQQGHGGGFGGFPPAEVTTQAVTPQSFPVAFEYVAQTVGSKDVEVRARVTGIVEKRHFAEGAAVRAGQLLFVIDPKPYEATVAAAEAELARAQAQKAQAERELARLKPLAERRAIGQKEADDAQSNVDFANAAVKAADARLASARLDLGYTRVVAPIAGLSSRAQVSEGALANANQTQLTIVSQVDPIWVQFNLPENEQLGLRKAVSEGRLVLPKDNAYEVTIRLADGSTFPRRGRINFSDTRINPATGTYEMRAEVGNGDLALKPGQFVRVVLRGAQRKDALTVPQVAVLDGPQGKFVYVTAKDKDGKDVAQQQPIVLGDWVDGDGGNRFVVESGLKPGETIIVDGIARLMPGASIKIVPAGAVPAVPGGTPPAKGEPAKKS